MTKLNLIEELRRNIHTLTYEQLDTLDLLVNAELQFRYDNNHKNNDIQ